MTITPPGEAREEKIVVNAVTSGLVTIPHGEVIVLQCRVCREDVSLEGKHPVGWCNCLQLDNRRERVLV